MTDYLKLAIDQAIITGVDPQTFSLLMLFPAVAVLVAFSRNVIGLMGFGLLVPVLVTYAFLTLGIGYGVLVLIVVLLAATLSRRALKKVKLSYLPRMVTFVWIISVVIMLFGIGVRKMFDVSIFPVIIFVMLAESNLEAQITRTWQEALLMTLETVFVAVVGVLIIRIFDLRNLVLAYPTISMVMILGLNLLIARYKGLRLMETWRFRKIISKF